MYRRYMVVVPYYLYVAKKDNVQMRIAKPSQQVTMCAVYCTVYIGFPGRRTEEFQMESHHREQAAFYQRLLGTVAGLASCT